MFIQFEIMTPQTYPNNENEISHSQADPVELIEPDSNREDDQLQPVNPVNEEQEVEVTRSSSLSSLMSGINSVAYDVSSYWAKVHVCSV